MKSKCFLPRFSSRPGPGVYKVFLDLIGKLSCIHATSLQMRVNYCQLFDWNSKVDTGFFQGGGVMEQDSPAARHCPNQGLKGHRIGIVYYFCDTRPMSNQQKYTFWYFRFDSKLYKSQFHLAKKEGHRKRPQKKTTGLIDKKSLEINLQSFFGRVIWDDLIVIHLLLQITNSLTFQCGPLW